MKILKSFLVTAFLLSTATLASAKPVRPADNNGDGEVTRRERAVERFERMDTNDDGMISKDEFMTHHKERMDKMRDRKDDRRGQKDAKDTKAKHPNKGKHVKRGRLGAKKIKAAKSKSV